MDLFNSRYFYFIVLAITISYPILRSFEKRIEFYKSWNLLLPAICIMMIIHVPIDIVFTKLGVWSFNHNLVYGFFLADLPIEEWLFFIIIPFACLFIYKVSKYFFKTSAASKLTYNLTLLCGIVLIILAIFFYDKIYTSFYFSISGATMILIYLKKPYWWKDFLFMYLLSLAPFLLVNGMLTGSFTNNAIVIYNESHIIGLRILNIPIEDTIYCFEILVTVVAAYEYIKSLAKPLSIQNNQ